MMNQILCTKLISHNNKKVEKKNWFKFQFAFSFFTMLILIFSGIFYSYQLSKKEEFSKNLIANYHIYRLYHTSQENTHANQEISNGLFRNHSYSNY